MGDVVWGKIHGFPWWPGKILSITCGGGGGCDVLTSSNGATVPQAHVSWYGSPTSSLIQCDQLGPFLENFKVGKNKINSTFVKFRLTLLFQIRYNKRKRGPYKEAVKQATTEARENAENKPSMAASNSPPTAPPPPPPRNIINVVPPALASPREIDVVS